MKGLVLVLVALALAGLGVSLYAAEGQTATYRVYGRVTNQQGIPLNNTQVLAWIDPNSSGSNLTDQYGNYEVIISLIVTATQHYGDVLRVCLNGIMIPQGTCVQHTIQWNAGETSQRIDLSVYCCWAPTIKYSIAVRGLVLQKNSTLVRDYPLVTVTLLVSGIGGVPTNRETLTNQTGTDGQGRYLAEMTVTNYELFHPIVATVCLGRRGEVCSMPTTFPPITANVTIVPQVSSLVLNMPDFIAEQIPPITPPSTGVYYTTPRTQVVATEVTAIYSTWLTFTGFVLVISGVIAAVVWNDAKNLGKKNAPLWAVGTFLVLIVVLPIYLIFRSKGMIGIPWKTQLEESSQATLRRAESPSPSTMFCPECGKTIPRSSKFCKECGAKLL